MRISPVCQYVTNELNTTISLYNANETLIKQYLPAKQPVDFFADYPELISFLLANAKKDYPVFSFVNNYICYVSFLTTEGCYVIGPFHLLFVGEDIHAKNALTIDSLLPNMMSVVPAAYPPFALKYVLLLFNCYQTHNLTIEKCYQNNLHTEFIREEANVRTTADIFSNRENQKMHNPYDQELRLLKSIEDGDAEKLRQTWEEDTVSRLGTTAIDPVRNGKNMAIYAVTASGRAAIRGGLSAEYVFSLTDTYSQQIESLKDMMLLQSLVQDAEMNFAQMVADKKKEKKNESDIGHPLIRKCKNYVFQHLHSRLTVQEIAAELDVHPNFLSSLFQTQEGISLYQYILQQKIDLTKNLLTYSNYSYIEIAHYLGFTSQSHLGSRFKEITGMTLKQYRDTYKKEEFS